VLGFTPTLGQSRVATLADVHVWLLFSADDLALISKSIVGLQQQLDALQQFCVERGLTVNVKKQKSWCLTLLTHAKSLCLKVMLLSVCKPSNPWDLVKDHLELGQGNGTFNSCQ
jgi:hypothetical protein